ncbi:oligosaccharyl transferase, archaeosortase A system-associated [Chloroflexota bacterium]
MKESKISPKILSGILVALFFSVALCIRVCLPYDRIFSADWIKFSSNDAYFHMRLIDNLVHNFPHLTTFDPYAVFPGGAGVGGTHLFDWLLAGIAWVIGLGSPTQHTIDIVAVYFPAVLGSLIVIPVYFIGKELFGRWAGVLSAGLLAIMSGEFLGRSILGFTDHHVAETLLATVVILFLILAIKAASQRQLTFSHLKHRDWATSGKALIYSLLTGFFLGTYLLTWGGGLLFVFIISVFFVVQFIIDHLRHKSSDYLCLVGVITFSIAVIMFLPSFHGKLHLTSMVVALLIPLVLNGISWLMASKKLKPAYYPLTVVGLGLAGLGLFYLINPSLISSMLGLFTVFTPAGVKLTTIEMQPLLFPGGVFSLAVAWGNFSTSFFISLVSLGMLIYFVVKQRSAEKTLMVVWSLIMLAAILGQRRFGYYFAVNVTLLTGYLSWRILELVGFKELAEHPAETLHKRGYYLEAPQKRDYYETLGISIKATKKEIKKAFQKLAFQYRPDTSHGDKKQDEERFKEINEAYEVLSNSSKRVAYDRSRRTKLESESKKGRPSRRSFHITIKQVNMALAVLLIFFVVFSPNFLFPTPGKSLVAGASKARYAPSDAWCSSLLWLRENTPDPFGDPDFYYHLETSHKYSSLSTLKKNIPNPSGDPDFYYQLEGSYKYPESAYGVMAWWDYGNWITRIAHRIPNANPGQEPGAVTRVASFFTSQDENSANEIAQELHSSYVMIDYETAYIDPQTASSKFWAIALWAGREQSEFADVYLEPEQGYFVAKLYFHPEYYRSLAIRLYNFDGKAVIPENTVVISYQEQTDQQGNIYKVITSTEQFDSYEEAEAYLLSQESANCKIVSDNPLVSPVPLEELKPYKLIHNSESSLMLSDGRTMPAVKIFEYID